MAYVALTSLRATMKLEFLQPNNPRVPLDDEAFISINSLFETLSSLQASVQKKSGGGPETRKVEMQIRDFALEAEDCIETQLSNFLLANNAEDQQKASQKLHHILQEAAKKATKLLKLSYSIIRKKAVKNESGGSVIPWLKHDDSASEPSNVMVGRRRDREVIMNEITVSFFKDLKVVTIVGMAGIGKTTLVRSVYEDPKVASIFDVRGWVSMPADGGYNNVSQMLHTLLWTVVAEAEETKTGKIRVDDDVAAEQVYKCLKGKRYLIVLDNLPNNEAWNEIRHCLPDDRNESRIVITTTHFLRRDRYTYSDGIIHNMTLLNSEESWTLFCNNPFLKLKKHMAPSKFQEIRSEVVEICEGLPYSILVVAKRLSECDNINQEWKKVEKEIELLGVLDKRALTHTYNQLPQHLKACFLYFGVFPKRTAIKVKLLISLWIAEGFINPSEGKELESRALEYLQEFIDRSLILIDSCSSFSGKIKNCRMHSALHSFCVREAQKEGIFCALNTLQLPRGSFSMFANSCRWLSLYTHKFDYYVLLRTNNPRSIFFFNEDDEISVSFKFLRVLAFVPSSFLQRVPTRLQDLVFLRYLSVTEWFEGLDYVVSTNRNLQKLVVLGKESQFGAATCMPCTILESPQLQHLELDKSYVIDLPSMDKDNMQTLSWVCPTHCRTRVSCRFPNIEKLEVLIFCNNPFILDNLEYLKQLEILSISVSFGCVVILPNPSMFPPQLKKLTFNDANLSERDLKVIGMLPQLEVLKLENAFSGKEWEVEEGLFVRLKFLLLEDKTLRQWMVSGDESFPCLEHLILRFCYRLKEVPWVMKDIPDLELIELECCCLPVINSAKCIQDYIVDYTYKSFELKIKGSPFMTDEEDSINLQINEDVEDSISSDDE